MQDIADAAGVTKAALYYHFKDKIDLVSSILETEECQLKDGMDEFCTSDADLRTALEATAAFLFRSMQGDLPRLIMDVYKQLPRDTTRKLKMQQSVFDDSCVTQLLRDAAEEGVTDSEVDPELASMLWFGMVFAQIRVARMGDGLPMEPDVLARIITGIFLDGFLNNPVSSPER